MITILNLTLLKCKIDKIASGGSEVPYNGINMDCQLRTALLIRCNEYAIQIHEVYGEG